MSATSVVLAGREAAEALMVDTCRIERLTGQVRDEATGQYVPAYEPVYEGPCKVQTRDVQPLTPTAGDQAVVVTRFEVHVPVSVRGVEVDDVVEVTAVGPVSDPELVGRRFRVAAQFHKSKPTARRFPVEETQA